MFEWVMNRVVKNKKTIFLLQKDNDTDWERE